MPSFFLQGLVFTAIGFGLLAALFWLVIVRQFAHALIYMAFGLAVGLTVAMGVFCLYLQVIMMRFFSIRGSTCSMLLFFKTNHWNEFFVLRVQATVPAVFLFLYAALISLYVCMIRDRIEFAAACLETAAAFVGEFPSTIVASFFFLIIQVRHTTPN